MDSTKVTANELYGLPFELLSQLIGYTSKTQSEEMRFIHCIERLNGEFSIDKLLIEYWKQYQVVLNREKTIARLTRMVAKNTLTPHPTKKGVYFLNGLLMYECGWQPIETAPKDGTRVFGYCVDDADPYFNEDTQKLTIYGAHTEGFTHVEDGIHIIEWGGAFDDSTWEATGAHLPDWWFLAGSEFQVTANPTHWMLLPKPPKQ